MSRSRFPGTLAAAAWLSVLAALPPPASADDQADAPRAAVQSAADAARAALVRGPASVALRDQATLALPAHCGFVPQKEGAALMHAMGNRTGEEFVGLVVPLGDSGADWLVTVDYSASGYIKDDDAKHWDADKLLKTLQDGTEAANADRVKIGVPPIVVTRWVEPPDYTVSSHELVWAAEVKQKSGATSDPIVNYNTYVLGREGYLSLDLVAREAVIEQDKPAAQQLLEAVQFNSGKRYSDFNSSTDKVAAYGLAALVAGVAAKKLGLLALLAATVVKFAKVIGLAIVAAVVAIKKWLGMGRKAT